METSVSFAKWLEQTRAQVDFSLRFDRARSLRERRWKRSTLTGIVREWSDAVRCAGVMAGLERLAQMVRNK